MAGQSQFPAKIFITGDLQAFCTLGTDRPDNCTQVPRLAPQGQKGQDLTFIKPLARNLGVRLFALHAGGQRPLVIGGNVPLHTPFLARAACLTLAHHGQCRRFGGIKNFNQGLKAHGVCQAGFEHWHIHNPVQCIGGGLRGVKRHLTAIITLYLHGQHWCGVLRVGPAAHGFQQLARRQVQSVRTHIRGGVM